MTQMFPNEDGVPSVTASAKTCKAGSAVGSTVTFASIGSAGSIASILSGGSVASIVSLGAIGKIGYIGSIPITELIREIKQVWCARRP